MCRKPRLLPYIFFLLLAACSKEDNTGPEKDSKLDRIEITSFRILENSSVGLTTETKLVFESSNGTIVTDHGVHILKEGSLITRFPWVN